MGTTSSACRPEMPGFRLFSVPESDVFMCWLWLSLAIVLEVAATILMKLSNGFTRVVPTVSMIGLYALGFIPLVFALKSMEVGAVYAIWSAVGTALVALVGVVLFHEPANALKVVAIVLIIGGVVCLNLSMRQPGSPSAAGSDPQRRGSLNPQTRAPLERGRDSEAPQTAASNHPTAP